MLKRTKMAFDFHKALSTVLRWPLRQYCSLESFGVNTQDCDSAAVLFHENEAPLDLNRD